MAALWDPSSLINVDPGYGFTCVGTKKGGSRCGNSAISKADKDEARNILSRLKLLDPASSTFTARANRELWNLAQVTLCPRWHRKPGYSQVDNMTSRWSDIIADFRTEQALRARANSARTHANNDSPRPTASSRTADVPAENHARQVARTRESDTTTEIVNERRANAPVSGRHQIREEQRSRPRRTQHVTHAHSHTPVASSTAQTLHEMDQRSDDETPDENQTAPVGRIPRQARMNEPQLTQDASDQLRNAVLNFRTAMENNNINGSRPDNDEMRVTGMRIPILMDRFGLIDAPSIRTPESGPASISVESPQIHADPPTSQEQAPHVFGHSAALSPHIPVARLAENFGEDPAEIELSEQSGTDTPRRRGTTSSQPASQDRSLAQPQAGRDQGTPPRRTGVARRPLPADCYVCYERLTHPDQAVWCRDGCGQNICIECFETWSIDSHTCGFCRTPWRH